MFGGGIWLWLLEGPGVGVIRWLPSLCCALMLGGPLLGGPLYPSRPSCVDARGLVVLVFGLLVCLLALPWCA